jgi:hypothetical protein
MTPTMMLIALLMAHAFFDYAGQGDFMSKAKNRYAAIPGVPWAQALGSHALMHGGAVALITGMPALGILEFVAHWVTDDLKCSGKIGFNTDQAIHIACKAVWWMIAIALASPHLAG